MVTNMNKYSTPEDELLTVKEVAALFKISTRTVYRWIEQKKLSVVRLPSGRLRFRAKEVLKLLEEVR